MGKFPNSLIHERYSDWHWKLIESDQKYKRLYVSDIDRLWIEYDFTFNAVVAVIDIKWENNNDGFTATEKGIYEWFERVGAKFYIVYIAQNFSTFRIIDSRGNQMQLDSIGYADWLLSLRSRKPERTPA